MWIVSDHSSGEKYCMRAIAFLTDILLKHGQPAWSKGTSRNLVIEKAQSSSTSLMHWCSCASGSSTASSIKVHFHGLFAPMWFMHLMWSTKACAEMSLLGLSPYQLFSSGAMGLVLHRAMGEGVETFSKCLGAVLWLHWNGPSQSKSELPGSCRNSGSKMPTTRVRDLRQPPGSPWEKGMQKAKKRCSPRNETPWVSIISASGN